MKEIVTKQIEQIAVQPTNNSLSIGGWDVAISPIVRVFDKDLIKQGENVIKAWSTVFPKEETYVQNTLGVPSLFVRLDCTVTDGVLGVYEVEERPAGIGLTMQVNSQFKENIEDIKTVWPAFSSVVSDDIRRKAKDDALWLSPHNIEDDAELVLVRAEPEEESFYHYEERSVSSLKKKGDKSYGESLNMWKKVQSVDEIDFETSFVIKPLAGSKTRDVVIYVPGPGSKRPPGASSRTKVETVFSKTDEGNGLYHQEFIHPMESGISDAYKWMMYRVFYGYNVPDKSWVCLGGSWVARYNLMLHGASDALSGSVIVEK